RRHTRFSRDWSSDVCSSDLVPLLGCAVFLIAAAHVRVVADAWTQLAGVVPAFILFLALAVLLAKWMARRFALPADQGRTLAFSFGTRNSFVVLPLALSLPAGWEMTPLVIVTQSMVELFGMMVYMWVVPEWVFPDAKKSPREGAKIDKATG